jgi:hypothetical protein
MTTSGSVDFTLTRNEIIRQALLLVSAITPDNSPSADMVSDASKMLNMMVKSWQTKVKLWPTKDITIVLAYPGKQSFTIGASGYISSENRPLKVIDARRKQGNTETPIDVMARSDFLSLPDKTTTGAVNQCYYDPQLTNGVLYVWPTATGTATSLVDGSTDLWTLSGSGTGEYYYTGSAISAEPTYIFENTVPMTEGTIGSLVAGEYVWGDNDALGTDTLYVRITGDGDPDAQVADYVESIATTPDSIIITVRRPLEDFDLTSNTPDFPQEWLQALVYNLAIYIAPQYNMNVPADVAALAGGLLRDLTEFDEEWVSMKIQPAGN